MVAEADLRQVGGGQRRAGAGSSDHVGARVERLRAGGERLLTTMVPGTTLSCGEPRVDRLAGVIVASNANS